MPRLRRLRQCRGQSARPAPRRRHEQDGRWAARPAQRLPRRRSAGRDQATPEVAAAASRALTWRQSTQRATPPPPRSRRSWAWVSFHASPLQSAQADYAAVCSGYAESGELWPTDRPSRRVKHKLSRRPTRRGNCVASLISYLIARCSVVKPSNLILSLGEGH